MSAGAGSGGRPPGRRGLPAAALALAAAALALAPYLAAGGLDAFINLDDDAFVYRNPQVSAGLRPAGIRWAFTTAHASNWIPLTFVSHMADVSLFGLDARGHHLVNALLFAAAAALLVLALHRLTGALWSSFFAAALFAVHPLRVESVAWVSQRRDVLALLALALALLCYERHVRRPSRGRLAAVALVFAAGLLAKPTLVALPFALMLLDFWPLGRLGSPRAGAGASALPRLLREKAPLLALSAGAAAATFVVQRSAGSVTGGDFLPVGARFANAAVAYLAYLGKTVWPSSLAVLYPLPWGGVPAGKWLAAAAALGTVTAAAVALARRHPALLAGWLWFCGMLVPMSGLVQVGTQSMADRYTLLPSVGLWVAVAWTAAALPARRVAAAAAVAALALFAAASSRQYALWRDGETLYRHTLAVTGENPVIRHNLGNVLLERGRVGEAVAEYREALRISPRFADPIHSLGNAYARLGDLEAAIAQYREALRARPGFGEARNNLAHALLATGRTDEAVGHFREALRLLPGNPLVRFNLAVALARRGDLEEAAEQYREVLRQEPGLEPARRNLSEVLRLLGRGSPGG